MFIGIYDKKILLTQLPRQPITIIVFNTETYHWVKIKIFFVSPCKKTNHCVTCIFFSDVFDSDVMENFNRCVINNIKGIDMDYKEINKINNLKMTYKLFQTKRNIEST